MVFWKHWELLGISQSELHSVEQVLRIELSQWILWFIRPLLMNQGKLESQIKCMITAQYNGVLCTSSRVELLLGWIPQERRVKVQSEGFPAVE